MRRRKLTLLLILAPIALGAASLYVWNRSAPGGESDPSIPLAVEQVPEDQSAAPAETDSATTSEGAVRDTLLRTPSAGPEELQHELAPPARAPAHADTGEAVGQPLLADTNSQPGAPPAGADDEPRSIRFASLYATRGMGGAGGLSSEGRSEAQTPGSGSNEQPVVPEAQDDAASPDNEGQAPIANTPEQSDSSADQGSAGSGVTSDGSAKGGSNDTTASGGSGSGGDSSTNADAENGIGDSGGAGAGPDADGTDNVSPGDPADEEGSVEEDQSPPSAEPDTQSQGDSGGDSTPGAGGFVSESAPPVVQVPEPGPLGLLLLGLLGIAARRKIVGSSK